MSRSYRHIRPTGSMVYSVADVQALYDVCRNTVSNWVSSGLTPSDSVLPQLFRGAELKRFHAERAARKREDLRHGEFKCLGCGHAVFPKINSVFIKGNGGRAPLATATCCDCGRTVMKLLSETECDAIKDCLTTNTSLAGIDESKGPDPACVGKDAESRGIEWHTINDRVVHEWQAYAGRYDPKTVQSHLVSIRDLERFLDGRPFDKVKPRNVGAYRDHIVRLLAKPKKEGGLSNSTVRHRASHLSAFFKWLRGQSGYRRLSASIPDYFALPRSASARQAKQEAKAYASIEEAWRMVALMPEETIVQRRDRAMVAFAYICGLRAGALTSIRFKHLDLENRTFVQDATMMRAKNGKSYQAKWFPRTEAFQEVFLRWVDELTQLGFQDEDAAFPELKDLCMRFEGTSNIEPLGSSRSLQTAFFRASDMLGKRYSPHSARHTLKALGVKICRTQEERKAWSMNLGHSDEQITERHYGKMSSARSASIIEALCSDEVFTEEENEMIIDFYERRFTRGTVEYRIARRLAEKREKARGDDDMIE
ncbi:hypothetical protein DL239_15125 [Sedimentitalea sp. CY04]|uniref:Site-specific recombinase XerD n=1 Tax=Parasedimentitalea denitrificans TaxID=2211118 RepID=A0ABX0W9H5_9RHOB|nr:site-specific integrase [Sedimentitalea sp. CY04]NIZ62306.1 hypothetical protein [Sedimentitalea sp. CY04]